jgi:hypothetical protein
LYFCSQTYDKLHLHKCVLPLILSCVTKNLEV